MNTGIVYCLRSTNPDIKAVYIGSTINLKNRMRVHRNYSKTKKTKIYNYINEYGGFDNWRCDILEKVEFSDKKQLYERERYYYEQYNDLLNTRKPGRSNQEWSIDNVDKLKKYRHDRYISMKKEKLLKSQITLVY